MRDTRVDGASPVRHTSREWFRQMQQENLGVAPLDDVYVPGQPAAKPAPVSAPQRPTDGQVSGGVSEHPSGGPAAGSAPATPEEATPSTPRQWFRYLQQHDLGVDTLSDVSTSPAPAPGQKTAEAPASRPAPQPASDAQPAPAVEIEATPAPAAQPSAPGAPRVGFDARPSRTVSKQELFADFAPARPDPVASVPPADPHATFAFAPKAGPASRPAEPPPVQDDVGAADTPPEMDPNAWGNLRSAGPVYTTGYGPLQAPPTQPWGYGPSFGGQTGYGWNDPYAGVGYGSGPVAMAGPWMNPTPCFVPRYPVWNTFPTWLMLGACMTSFMALPLMFGCWCW